MTGVFGEPYDAYDKQFNAAHQLLSETFFLPGPDATVGKIALPTAPAQIDLAVGTYLGSVVSGFGSGDTVDFQSVAFDAADTVTFTENAAKNGGTVAIDDASGAAVAQFGLLGSYSAANFSTSADTNGDLLIAWQAAAGDAVEAPMALTASSLVSQDPASDLHVDGVDLGISLPTGFIVADIGHRAGGALRDVMIRRRGRPAPASSDLCLTATSATGRRSAAALPAGATADARAAGLPAAFDRLSVRRRAAWPSASRG